MNHKLDHVVERTALPDELIRRASGRLALEDTQPRVSSFSMSTEYFVVEVTYTLYTSSILWLDSLSKKSTIPLDVC